MRFSSRLVLLAAGVAAAVALLAAPALGGSGVTAADTKNVSVNDDLFSPRAVTVAQGDKVVWRWKGSADHNVRFRKVPAGAKRPKGSTTKASGRFARTFSRKGTFRYVCTIHEDVGMKGRVVVD